MTPDAPRKHSGYAGKLARIGAAHGATVIMLVSCHKSASPQPVAKDTGRDNISVRTFEYGKDRQSCAAGLMCGSVSCCDSIELPGGTFRMGRSKKGRDAVPSAPGDVYNSDAFDVPEHAVTLSKFALDRFEVTVGRFRSFVTAYDGSPPKEGFGGRLGWTSECNSKLPDRATLEKGPNCAMSTWGPNWTDVAGANEAKPINCVNWCLALAFCLWDGGRLPTEAEWEYAAAGGDENRPFVWGDGVPPPCTTEINCPNLVVYGDSDPVRFRPVGSMPLGVGRWGHYDLAGSVSEWVFDAFDADAYKTPSPGLDPVVTTPGKDPERGTRRDLRGVRGGGYRVSSDLRVADRDYSPPGVADDTNGFRCARDVK
jgi:formylglycine-generating enzyme required for sulfatase activity